MSSRVPSLLLCVFLGVALTCGGQVTTGEILGVVRDPSGAVVAEARVTIRNLETNDIRNAASDPQGRFRFPQLQVGAYELAVEQSGFAKYLRGPIVLRLNQYADVEVRLQLAEAIETLTVTADAPLINTTNAEMGANFDRKRISELPLGPNRNILNLVLSVAGVSQLQSGQGASVPVQGGVVFSVNGLRLRSNNFMIDGQDLNSPNVTGLTQEIQNPDIVAEVRLITNQFAPEYGRASGSVVNLITKSGTNQFHGSAFAFHNDNHLNSRSNLDEAPVGTPPRAKFAEAPFRIENQVGGTLGGPVKNDKTFFFGSLERWTDRRQGSGETIRGVPTEEGRSILTALAGDRPTVRALIEHLPAAQAPVPSLAAPVTIGARTELIPLGTLSGSSNVYFDDWQWSARVDHRFNDRHTLGGRYLDDDRLISGDGQKTPPGLTTVSPQKRQAVSAFLNSGLSSALYNELRVSYQRFSGMTTVYNSAAERIPDIEVLELGLTGRLSNPSRKAIGSPDNLPMSNFTDSYQLQETIGVWRGPHSMKFGMDFRRRHTISTSLSQVRGQLTYDKLQDLVDDVAQTAGITRPLPGASPAKPSQFYEFFFFLQDEWRIRPRFTINYGVRYEWPGNPFANARKEADRIVANAGGDERFRLRPIPKTDRNNWAPRFGFNYRFAEGGRGLRWLTGREKLVVRGGYSRTYDPLYVLAAGDMRDRFPFAFAKALEPRSQNAFQTIHGIRSGSISFEVSDPDLLTRVTLAEDYRSQSAEQYALQFQRELEEHWVLNLSWVGTKGTGLTQVIDGNPTVPGSRGTRVDPTRGVVVTYCNCASSIYHSLQTSVEKRLSNDFSMAAHYTWSAFIDGASDNFAGSIGDPALPQDASNRRGNRARSSYDRPHRFTANGVYELPFQRQQKSGASKILGGWQLSGFLTFQSGAPFTALDGADPDFRFSEIASIRGNAIRAHLNTNLDVASMSVEEIVRAGGSRLFSRVTAESPLGSLGRNILRADGIGNLDLGIIKNTRVSETNVLQFRAEFYNLTNTRNYGIPEPRLSASANFLNQWGTDAGNRRIVVALRYMF